MCIGLQWLQLLMWLSNFGLACLSAVAHAGACNLLPRAMPEIPAIWLSSGQLLAVH